MPKLSRNHEIFAENICLNLMLKKTLLYQVARAINAEVKAGRGSPHGGVFLDVSKRIPADVIKKRLPSMWHQFYELAGVDITKEPMEFGPTCHYVMGGVEVDPDTAAAVGVPGLYAAGEVAAQKASAPAIMRTIKFTY
jgi:succinate dehydrogenase/fumarate reductase flavoprotein subunit